MNLNDFETVCKVHLIIIMNPVHSHMFLVSLVSLHFSGYNLQLLANHVFLDYIFLPKYHVFTILSLGTPVKGLFLSLFHPLDVAGTAFVSWCFQFLVSSQL